MAQMKLFGKYLSLELEKSVQEADQDPNELNFYLNVENLYLLEMVNSLKIMQGIQLSTEGFILQVHCGDTPLAKAWVRHLSKYCIRSNLHNYFKILQNLDRGGFAIVYLAEQVSTGRKVAIKMVDKSKIKTKRNYVLGDDRDLHAERD